jgi:hypothetical protein
MKRTKQACGAIAGRRGRSPVDAIGPVGTFSSHAGIRSFNHPPMLAIIRIGAGSAIRISTYARLCAADEHGLPSKVRENEFCLFGWRRSP